MTFRAEPRARTLAFLATAAALVVATLGSVPAQAAGGSSITITDPAAAGALTAGAVTLGGQVFLDSTPATTTVLFAVDVSGSTNYPSGRDCNGDGVADGGDNINNDPVVGDLLDCELAAVRALDSYLTQFAGSVLVGLEAFAGTAETANLSPDSPTTFIPPGYTGGDATSRMQFVTHNVVRNLIKKYPPAIELDASQTSFDAAVDRALSALSTAAAGPKYVILTSDVVKEGNVPGSMARPISQDRLDRLAASGVHMRTFSLGGSAGCDPGTSLARMAAVTGETCTPIVNPSTLQTSFLSGAPPAIRDVTVSVGGMSVAADTDAIGNWRTQLQLGQGSYTVTATARLTAGGSVSAQRVITVGPAALGTDPATVPAPGTVGLSPETRVATVVTARRPRPLRAALPRTITGRVAQTGQALGTTTGLNSASVLLQGRAAASSQWSTVARSKVVAGAYSLTWKRTKAVKQLQVVLAPHGSFAESSAPVRVARISACTTQRSSGVRTLTCHTTARRGTKARLLDHGQVLDRARVRKGVVSVRTGGRFRGLVLSVDITRARHIRLHL